MSIREPFGIVGDDEGLSMNEREAIEEIIHNEYYYRRGILDKLEHRSRDLYKECGYSETVNITNEMLYDLYVRFPIAARVVDLAVDESWRRQPDVYETEDEEEVTVFEKAWDALDEQLDGGDLNWFIDEVGSTVWEMLQRGDRLSRIGQYGVLFLELDDVGGIGATGDTKTWRDPAPGFEDSEAAGAGEYTTNLIESPVQEPAKGKDKSKDKEQRNPDLGGDVSDDTEDFDAKVKLLSIRAFDQTHAVISAWHDDPSSPMFGKPKEYTLTFHHDNATDYTTSSLGGSVTRDVKVHWSRVIHIADNLLSSEFVGIPAMLPVANDLQDLKKIYGASGEGYWRTAFPGLSFETHPILGAKAKINQEALSTEIERYKNTLDRYMATVGGSWKTLNNEVGDPTPHIEARIEAICIYLGCPVRIFKGSERGELASSQDKDSWDERMASRQQNFITPRIIVPFVNRLIAVGVLPEPQDGFRVNWPDLSTLGDLAKADLATKLTTAISQYVSGGADVLMSPNDFLVRVLGYDQEEAQQIEDAALEHTNEANPDAPDMTVAGVAPPQPNPMAGLLPDGSPDPNAPPMPPGQADPTGMPPGMDQRFGGKPKPKGNIPPQFQK